MGTDPGDSSWRLPHAPGAPAVRVGELGTPVPTVSHAVSARSVEEMFRRDCGLRAVAVENEDGSWSLLSRSQLDYQLAGRLGYGRALHARSAVSQLLPENQLIVPAETGLQEAADLALARPEPVRYDDFLLLGESTPLAVSVSRVFEELSASLRHAAWHDPLTGLPNRRWLAEQGPALLAVAEPQKTAILYVDLDNFKTVNDTHGHDTGNEVLVQVGERLRGTLRAGDVPVRLGGDEFIVLLTSISASAAQLVGTRVLEAILQPMTAGEQTLQLSATIGLAMADEIDGDDKLGPLDALLRHADGAMLTGKRRGKQRVQRLAGQRSDPFARVAQIRRQLTKAVERHSFDLEFEPVLDVATSSCSHLKAQLTWNVPNLGVLRSEEFLPIADRSGAARTIGRTVVDRVCAHARALMNEERASRIALAVSPAWLSTGELAADVLSALGAHGVPARLLQLDFSGAIGQLSPGPASDQLRELRSAGVQVALDSYGQGRATVAVLRSFPFNALIVDPSLASRIDLDRTDAVVLKGVVDIGHTLGMEVSATGVERPEQLAVLRRLGCDTAAGPLITGSLALPLARPFSPSAPPAAVPSKADGVICFAGEGPPNVSSGGQN